VHSARRFLQNMPSDHVLVKLDFSNAFNCLHRRDMLHAISDRLPELFHVCYAAYSQPSLLFFGSHIIESQEGPQQGDPLGLLLFLQYCSAVARLSTISSNSWLSGRRFTRWLSEFSCRRCQPHHRQWPAPWLAPQRL